MQEYSLHLRLFPGFSFGDLQDPAVGKVVLVPQQGGVFSGLELIKEGVTLVIGFDLKVAGFCRPLHPQVEL